jgi:SH3-like domain-containing protein
LLINVRIRTSRLLSPYRLPGSYRWPGRLLCVLLLVAISGCARFHIHPAPQYVYVQSKGTFLRDRVAAVSNKVADVHNGERLTVLQHERRFFQVRTAAGKVGWLEEHAVIDQAEYDKFEALKAEHANDPVVATAILRDELFLHLTAGRKTDHLFLLPENDKLQLLMRASVEKPVPPQGLPAAKPAVRRKRPVPGEGKPVKKVQSGSTIFAAAPPHPDPYDAPDLEPPDKPLEDWWLVRDQGGHVGWVLARRLDVDVPDSVAQYSEGKRIVGAYQLNTVYDPGGVSEDDEAKAARKAAKAAKLAAKTKKPKAAEATAPPVELPGRQVPQYVTVTQEYKDGLPFDWNQVRVFIWNVKKHRYETAYRLREQQGYLPVTIGAAHFKDANGRDMGLEPTFTIRTTPDGVVTQDPATGAFHPQTVQETTYRLEGGIVRRADPPPPKPETAAPGFSPRVHRHALSAPRASHRVPANPAPGRPHRASH